MPHKVHRSTQQERNTITSFAGRLRAKGVDVVGPGALRVLAVILDERRPCTIRKIARRLRIQINAVTGHLDRLQRVGLIRREPGMGGTIRAACRFVAADKLEEE